MILFDLFVQLLLQEHFKLCHCLLIFTDDLSFNPPIIDLPKILISIDEDGKFSNSIAFNYFGCQGFLIKSSRNSQIIQAIESAIRYSTMERFNHRRYLILEENEDSIEDLFLLKELDFIADFLLILQNKPEVFNLTGIFDHEPTYQEEELRDNGTLSFYTHKFVGINDTRSVLRVNLSCFEVEDLLFYGNISTWSRLSDILYGDKLSDGMGRPFRIATFTYKPYSVPGYSAGTELQIALEFSKSKNLTPVYVIDEEGEWGEIYDNWTGYGVLGNVMYDNADVGLGALYTWAHEYGYLDLSKPVVRTGITCLAPAPRLASGWLVPLFSFTYEMWIAVGLTFMVCSGVLTLLNNYSGKARNQIYPVSRLAEESVLDTAAIFLQQAFNRFGVQSQSKSVLHGCMFVFSILIASSYSSGLASSMTVPRYVGAIRTVQDLVDSGIQWGATSIAWIMSIMEAEEYNYRVLVERFVKTDGPRLKKYNNKRFAFSVERLPAGQYAIGDYITEEGVASLKLMIEDLYWEQCVLMTKKSSIWAPHIDQFILTLAQTGIPQIWEYKVAVNHLNAKIQRAVQYSSHHGESSSTPVQLHISHVQGAFGILMIGCALAFLVFLLEQLIARRKRNLTIANKDL